MEEKIENPQAFPVGWSEFNNGDGSKEIGYPEQGMSLRDYFAAKAIINWREYDKEGNLDVKKTASQAYQIADAMLIEKLK